jgi:hypothetical protein
MDRLLRILLCLTCLYAVALLLIGEWLLQHGGS